MKPETVTIGYSGTGLVLAFVAGAAVGTIAALLLAPAPGEETRRRVQDAAREAARKVRERIPGLAEEAPATDVEYAPPIAAAR